MKLLGRMTWKADATDYRIALGETFTIDASSEFMDLMREMADSLIEKDDRFTEKAKGLFILCSAQTVFENDKTSAIIFKWCIGNGDYINKTHYMDEKTIKDKLFKC